jgi:hypothetical protein
VRLYANEPLLTPAVTRTHLRVLSTLLARNTTALPDDRLLDVSCQDTVRLLAWATSQRHSRRRPWPKPIPGRPAATAARSATPGRGPRAGLVPRRLTLAMRKPQWPASCLNAWW